MHLNAGENDMTAISSYYLGVLFVLSCLVLCSVLSLIYFALVWSCTVAGGNGSRKGKYVINGRLQIVKLFVLLIHCRVRVRVGRLGLGSSARGV